MTNQLTSHENQFLKEFIKESEKISRPPKYLFLYTSITYVFFPGLVGGIGIILSSLLILKHFKNVTARKKLAVIIKKLT